MVKLLQFVVIPGFVGAVGLMIAPALFPVAANRQSLQMAGAFAAGFFGANMLIGFTPIAGFLPKFAGMTYDKYR